MADPQPHGRPPDADAPHEPSKNLPEMAPRQTHTDLKHFSEPNLVDPQAGSDYSNTPYGYGGATHSTSTSRIDPTRPNLAPYWGRQDTSLVSSEYQVADKSSTHLTDDEKRSTIKSIDDTLSSTAAPGSARDLATSPTASPHELFSI